MLSSFIGSNSTSATFSGTSMATPHVTGLALYLQRLEGLGTPEFVKDRIVELGSRNGITGNLQGSPNLVAYNGNGA